jgi:hypothetical protein
MWLRIITRPFGAKGIIESSIGVERNALNLYLISRMH